MVTCVVFKCNFPLLAVLWDSKTSGETPAINVSRLWLLLGFVAFKWDGIVSTPHSFYPPLVR